MTPHLSPDEISMWVAGERTLEQEQHLKECSRCSGEVGEVERTLALFRESGKGWSGHWFERADDPVMRQRFTRRDESGSCGSEKEVAAKSDRRRYKALLPHVGMLAVAAAGVAVFLLAGRHTKVSVEAPFVEMPYVAPLAPYERSEVVR